MTLIPPEPVPEPVRDLISGPIESMDHVELLVLLVADENRSWSAEELAPMIHSETTAVRKYFSSLLESGLLARTDSDGQATYRFAPRTAALRTAAEQLSVMYHQRPVTLVRAIYARVPNPVRSFADAFRLRGPGEK